jgi:DNA-binding MarR family transcriptional regulator
MGASMNWKQLCKYMQEMRVFNRLILYQRSLIELSTNELDLLSRIAISEKLLSAKELLDQMSSNKVIISRLIKKLISEGFLIKVENLQDERSYYLKITEKGKKILEKDYEKIILPISVLEKKMGEKDFIDFMNQISNSNKILKGYYENRGDNKK